MFPVTWKLRTFQAALYIETHSLMHQSEFHAASVALSRAADKRKSLINIHKNGYAATLRPRSGHAQLCLYWAPLGPYCAS